MTGSATLTRKWPANGTPAIESAHPPLYYTDHHEMREMAQNMLRIRQERFPELVAKGEMDADEAKQELALFAQIAGHWHWVITGEGEPAPRITIVDRCAVLDQSIRRIAEIASKRGGFDQELLHQAHCVIAMRFNAAPSREDDVICLAKITHELRQPKGEQAHAA